jgi:hypothetical protein
MTVMSALSPVDNNTPLNYKTVLYFTASNKATATELLAIARLKNKYGFVRIRSTLGASYGSNLEPAEAVAGTVPAAYTTAIANYSDGNVTQGAPANPEALGIFPSAPLTFVHTGTYQLSAVAADIAEGSDTVTLTDETAIGATGVWTSGTPGVMTVGASTGLLTGVTAGTSLITFTLTRAGGTAVVATKTVTAS